GCAQVYQIIQSRGLDKFYDLKPGTVAPVGNAILQSRDFSWLKDAANRAETAGSDHAELNLDVQGLSCIGCVWLIEKIFNDLPGSMAIEVSPQQGGMHLVWKTGAFDVVAFAAELQRFGYLVGPGGRERGRSSDSVGNRMGL